MAAINDEDDEAKPKGGDEKPDEMSVGAQICDAVTLFKNEDTMGTKSTETNKCSALTTIFFVLVVVVLAKGMFTTLGKYTEQTTTFDVVTSASGLVDFNLRKIVWPKDDDPYLCEVVIDTEASDQDGGYCSKSKVLTNGFTSMGGDGQPYHDPFKHIHWCYDHGHTTKENWNNNHGNFSKAPFLKEFGMLDADNRDRYSKLMKDFNGMDMICLKNSVLVDQFLNRSASNTF
jgi:hypothetical protein